MMETFGQFLMTPIGVAVYLVVSVTVIVSSALVAYTLGSR